MADEKRATGASQEHDILSYWETHSVFEKSIENRPAEKAYTFYDGPPFATGLPHYGHIVASVMKDLAPRYWTMKGRRVERTWGWDCHGLPIENIIEKKLDLKSRADIEAFGIGNFNDACHDTVLTYADEWKKVIRRIGRWVDMENSYKTMDLSYMESIWWVFRSLWERGLVYEGHKPMHICPRCETALSNFEVSQNYQDVTDISVFAGFTLTSGAHAGAKLVAWTTTPWTLPGNVLLAVGADMEYVLIEKEGTKYLIGKAALARLSNEKDFPLRDAAVVGSAKGSDLVGATYEPLFPYFKEWENAFRVVAAEFVSTEDGTQVVHIAPGFGDDDMELGKREQVKPLMHVLMNGTFVPELVEGLVTDGFAVKGRPVKSKEDGQGMDVEIIKALAKRGSLVWKKKIQHSYPHCWRCDTPLLNYATSSWFVRVTELKAKLLEHNEGINWVPENMKEGRFGKWLEGARDWAVSRSRFWGTPIPVWRAEDGDVLCLGSRDELAELSGVKVTDLHKHIVDPITITKGGKTYARVPDVLDCWFESGSMPYAQLHYPFENAEKFDAGFPAEFIAEGQDQTRGWFYTLHVLATALFDKPAFRNVVVNGIVLAEDGKKMSKRLNNYPDPMEVVEKHGADAVRLYLMSSPVVHGENLRFSEAGVDEVNKKFVMILKNVVSFYQLYATPAHTNSQLPNTNSHVLDRWILSRLHETLKAETKAMDAYDFAGAARPLSEFVADLSQWYVRRSRDRFKASVPLDKVDDRGSVGEAVMTLRVVLDTFAKMIAPFAPFLAEHVYQAVEGSFAGVGKRLSVHLEDWPEADETLVDGDLLADMARVRSVVSKALERRAEAGKNVRQALSSMTVSLPSGELAPELVEILKDEVNVKAVIVKKGDAAVEIDATLTPELVREGTSREVIRKINAMRKEAGLTIQDRIVVFVESSHPDVKLMLDEHKDSVITGTLAKSLRTDGAKPANAASFRANEMDMTVGFEKTP
ncbi:isoleucine--tRNA ligase [Patescibacteria group bacterium]|nr:MAG: isoleucine--tRNA ligase [Patescibacteria group bacterium]